MRDVTKKVNVVIRHIETDDITQTNLLWQQPLVRKKVAVRKGKIGKKKEPWWKRRLESDITNVRRDINSVEREKDRRNWRERKEKD